MTKAIKFISAIFLAYDLDIKTILGFKKER